MCEPLTPDEVRRREGFASLDGKDITVSVYTRYVPLGRPKRRRWWQRWRRK